MADTTLQRRRDKSSLKLIATRLASACRAARPFGLEFVAPSRLVYEETDTDGWFVTLAKVPKRRGCEIQLWLDNYPNVGSRRASICLKSANLQTIDDLAASGVGSFGKARRVDESIRSKRRDASGSFKMVKPLADKDFERPIAELYSRSPWSFYMIYFPDQVNSKSAGYLLPRLVDVALKLARTSAGLNGASDSDRAYPAQNRSVVHTHLVRERSARLAHEAKVRDNFTCQICEANFADMYGDIGSGFAEAHHIVHLSSPRAKKATALRDLKTVCANCHRMLHRVESGPAGFKKVLAAFKAAQMG